MNVMKIVPILTIAGVLAACGGGSYSHYEAGNLVVMEGVVDNVVRSDIPNKKLIYSVTSVGFENGEGVNLVGIYPGISRGKHVKITAEFVENVNGTDLFKVRQIAAGGVKPAHPVDTNVQPPVQSIPAPAQDNGKGENVPKPAS